MKFISVLATPLWLFSFRAHGNAMAAVNPSMPSKGKLPGYNGLPNAATRCTVPVSGLGHVPGTKPGREGTLPDTPPRRTAAEHLRNAQQQPCTKTHLSRPPIAWARLERPSHPE